jgi:branched-chain amino acid transport system permease protein
MEWVNAVIQGILLGGVFALFATGLSLAFGIMRLANLAHGTLALLAAFIAYSIVDATGVNPLVALVVVVPIMFVVGYVLERGLLNFTLGSDPLPAILVTFGLAVVIENLLLERYSADARGLDAGSIESASIRLTDDIAIGWFPLMTLAVAVGVLGLLYVLFARTRAGRAFRAISDDRATGRLMGINDRHYYALAMGIALATVAIAGVFLGIRTTFSPADGNALLLFGFEAVIIGGLGSLWGTLAGGIILGVAQTVGAEIEPGWSVLTGHVVFLAVLALRPNGLFGKALPA